MKRLWVFVCIVVTALSFFGGFSGKERVFAAPPGTFNIAIQEVLEVFTSPNSTKARFQDNYNPKQKTEYAKSIKTLKDYLSVRAQDEPATRSKTAFKIDSLNDFEIYLNARLRDETDPELIKVIKDTLSLRNNLHTAVAVDNFDQAYYIAAAGGVGDVQSADAVKNAAANAVAVSQEFGAEKVGTCSINFNSKETFSLGACINEGVTWIIKNTLLEIAGFLVWLTANMFNYVVQIGVLDFSKWAPDTLYPLWIIVRQIVSLIIVFVGLYLGFLYIIGDPKGKFEHYIPWVIIFGLFVNFSYPLARTAIDVSNIVSLKIYTSAVGNEALTADPKNAVNIFTSESSAGAIIMNKLGLKGLVASAVSPGKSSTGNGSVLGKIDSIPGALLAVVFVLYAAFIFFMVTAIIAMRTAVLVFITVASPLLLVDSVLPLLGEKAQELRKVFFEQLIVGPVFMVMFALTLKFLDVFSNAKGPIGVTAINGISSGAGSAGTITTFFNLLMMLIMLHIMITVTKKVSGDIGKYATNAMGKVGGFGLGVASAGTGFLARKGIGGLAVKARESKWVQNNQDSFIGRRTYDLSNSLANSTYDLRNSKTVAGGMGKIGMGMGMGAKLGYEGESQARIKNIAERGARIKTRYERDVYKKDAAGNTVLAHRKGDIDEESNAAKNRYLQNNGGAIFLTKKEKDILDDDLTKEYTDTNEKYKNEISTESSKDLTEYNSLKGKTVKENFVNNLNKELSELKKTDKNGTGTKSKAIIQTLEAIEKKNIEEKDAFDKKAARAIKELNDMSNEKKQDYYARLDDEVKEVLASTKTPNTIDDKGVTRLGKTVYSRKEDSNNIPQAYSPTSSTRAPRGPSSTPHAQVSSPSSVPILNTPDLTLETTEQISERLNGTTSTQTPPQRNTNSTPLGVTEPAQIPTTTSAVDIDLTTPFDSTTIHTTSFAQRAAAKRQAALEKASVEAQKNMDSNNRKPDSPDSTSSIIPTPPPTTSSGGTSVALPVTPTSTTQAVSNESRFTSTV